MLKRGSLFSYHLRVCSDLSLYNHRHTKSVLHILAHTASTWRLHATKTNKPTLKTGLKLKDKVRGMDTNDKKLTPGIMDFGSKIYK